MAIFIFRHTHTHTLVTCLKFAAVKEVEDGTMCSFSLVPGPDLPPAVENYGGSNVHLYQTQTSSSSSDFDIVTALLLLIILLLLLLLLSETLFLCIKPK